MARDATVSEHLEEAPHRRGLGPGLAATALAGAFAGWCLLSPGTPWLRTVVSDAVFVPTGGLMLFCAARRSRLPQSGRSRQAWALIASAFAAWWIGDVIWAFNEVGREQAPFPSAADAGYLLFYPAFLCGIARLVDPASRGARFRVALDSATVFVAATGLMWYFVAEPATRDGGAPWLVTTLTVAYPVGDVLLVFATALVLLRQAHPFEQAATVFLMAGALAFVAADVAYARLSLSGSYVPGSWPDVLWLFGEAMFIWAATSPGRARSDPATTDPYVGGTIPLLSLVAAAYSLVLFLSLGAGSSGPSQVLLATAVALSLLVVTRQTLTLRENRALVQRLTASERRTRAFVADAAHQLRTPIAGIRASAELLEDQRTAHRKDLLRNLVRETERAGRLVTGLLRTARLDEGDPLRFETVDATDLCRDEVERVARQSPTVDVELRVTSSAEATLRRVSIDTRVFQEILANVLENATRHAASRVDVTLTTTHRHVEVAVRDDGDGVPGGMEDRIFERFVSVGGQGAGLGLPIARELARSHGGDVTYDDGAFVVRLRHGVHHG